MWEELLIYGIGESKMGDLSISLFIYIFMIPVDPSCPTKPEYYWIDTLETKAPMVLNFGFNVSESIF